MFELMAKERAQIEARHSGIDAFRRELEDENAHIEDAVAAAISVAFATGYGAGKAENTSG